MEVLERPRRTRRTSQALVAVVRCGPGRGIAALQVIDESGAASEHFIPFTLQELPSQLGHDYTYAGLIAVLERLHVLDVHRALIQTDDAAVVDDLERRTTPHRDLTLPYVILGCKLNEFASARVVAVPDQRVAALRAKALALASTVYRSVA